jgi:hypothetical protein
MTSPTTTSGVSSSFQNPSTIHSGTPGLSQVQSHHLAFGGAPSTAVPTAMMPTFPGQQPMQHPIGSY